MEKINNYYKNLDDIFSVSTESTPNSELITPEFHFHDSYEIYYCGCGPMSFVINQKIYDINEGDLLIMNNIDVHKSLPPKNGDYIRSVILFSREFIETLSTHQTDLTSAFRNHSHDFCHKVTLNNQEQQHLMHLINEAKVIISSTGYGNDIRKKIILAEILLFVNEQYKNNQSALVPSPSYSNDATEYFDYIHSHVYTPLTLSQLSKKFSADQSTITRKFKKATGFTIRQYIINYRISLSKKFLCEGDSVLEASIKCGFGSLSNYIRTFNTMVGMSPKRYQTSRNIVNKYNSSDLHLHNALK